jgi:hypothetical protein
LAHFDQLFYKKIHFFWVFNKYLALNGINVL